MSSPRIAPIDPPYTPEVQAVRHAKLKLLLVAFWKAGEIAKQSGSPAKDAKRRVGVTTPRIPPPGGLTTADLPTRGR